MSQQANQRTFEDVEAERLKAEQEKRVKIDGNRIEIDLGKDDRGSYQGIVIKVLDNGIEVMTIFSNRSTALVHSSSNVFLVGPVNFSKSKD